MPELQAMSVTDLRAELRKRHPSTKGPFSAFATKEVCVSILSGEYPPEAWEWKTENGKQNFVLKAGYTANPDATTGIGDDVPASASVGKDNVDDLPSGDHGHVAEVITPTDEVALSRAVKMIEVIDPSTAKAIRTLHDEVPKLRKQLADALEHAAVRTVVQPLAPSGKSTTICGIDCPIISQPGDDVNKFVPRIDPHYNFGYWRSERKTAASTLRQGADDLLKLLLANWRLHLVGPPGVGKTSVIEQIAARLGWPFVRMQGDKDVTTSDFLGEKTVTNGNIEFVYGVLPTAMKIGAIFVADEIDYFPADCRTSLNPVTEPNGRLVLTANGGEVITPHPNFRIIATSNTKGFGDDTGLYPDAKVQNAALLSRFNATFQVTWLTPGEEAKLLVAKTGVDRDLAKVMTKVAADTRKAAAENQLLYPLTTRHLMSWAEGAGIVGLEHAFALCVLNKVPDQDATVVTEIAQRHMGDKLQAVFAPGAAVPADVDEAVPA